MKQNIDDNLEQGSDGAVNCRHCGHVVGNAENELGSALIREQPPAAAGPAVHADAANFADRRIVLRQSCCPECLTQLQAEVVPADEPSGRRRQLAADA